MLIKFRGSVENNQKKAIIAKYDDLIISSSWFAGRTLLYACFES